MGAGIAITRGAAGALSFCMAVVLLTVCRNVITVVRETPLGEFIPFDSAITFHKVRNHVHESIPVERIALLLIMSFTVIDCGAVRCLLGFSTYDRSLCELLPCGNAKSGRSALSVPGSSLRVRLGRCSFQKM